MYEKRFTSDVKPARVTVEVSKLPKNSNIKISCIAYKNIID
ncbi:MAG: RidA family protein [Candidatus Methanofastidiosum sp.]|nr:RidA family protein [Methanofastidiosum sp.]